MPSIPIEEIELQAKKIEKLKIVGEIREKIDQWKKIAESYEEESLNAVSEIFSINRSGRARGINEMCNDLEKWLKEEGNK